MGYNRGTSESDIPTICIYRPSPNLNNLVRITSNNFEKFEVCGMVQMLS